MTIETGWFIFYLVITFILGGVAGTFLTRFTLKQYFAKNPPISEDMIASMLTAMGQAPTKKRVNQIIKQIKGNNK